MHWIIDGHNLVPFVPGLSLQDPDDEEKLVQWLGSVFLITRDSADVYFDRAPAGYAKSKRSGRITAHFIQTGRTADDAILHRLQKEKSAARNLTVISSDRVVQANARSFHARVVTSAEFVRTALDILHGSQRRENLPLDLSQDELNEWMRLFEEKNGE